MDADEFDLFARQRGQRLARAAYLLTGDAGKAEDLVQSALTTLWLKGGAVDPAAWESWTRTTMINTFISWRRRRSFHEPPTIDVPDNSGADPTAAIDDRQRLRMALQKIPERQRAAVVLRHYCDLSEAETAAALGCAVGTVKSLTSRGLAGLRAFIDISGVTADPAAETATERRTDV